MVEEKKKGFLSKLFGGGKHSCCCDVRIEEVTEETKEAEDKSRTEQASPCCGPRPTGKA